MVDNPMVAGAAQAYESSLAPEVTQMHTDMAQQVVLADMDSFADAMAADCSGKDKVQSDWLLRVPGRLQCASQAELMYIILTAEDVADVIAARQELRTRWMQENESRIASIAQELAEGA